MEQIEEAYMQTHDIDWFVKINGVLISVASAGDLLPRAISRDGELLYRCQQQVLNLPKICDVTFNKEYLDGPHKVNITDVAQYEEAFRCFAARGFYAFDNSDINNPQNGVYHLVAWPNSPCDVEPIEGIPALTDIQLNFNIPALLINVHLVEIVNNHIQHCD